MARTADPSEETSPAQDPQADQSKFPPAGKTAEDDPRGENGAEKRLFAVRNDIHKRLDLYIQGRLKGISRNRVQKLIDSGGVRVNGRRPKHSLMIKRGDKIDVILPPPAIRTIEPEPISLDILYEDEWFIVINKQSNLIVHPARSNLSGTLVNGLAWHFKQQHEQSGRPWGEWKTRGFRPTRKSDGDVDGLSKVGANDLRPGIIHRLDKNTTGVMVVAKNDEAHWLIARQFEDRLTLKTYLALVHGGPEDAGGVIDQPIGKHPTYREPYAVRHDSAGKPSVTLYRVRRRYRGFSLLEVELKTGRTHQIRVHLSYMGWPVVGDIFYGGAPIGESDLDDPPVPAGARRHLNFARDRDEGRRVEAAAAARKDLIIAHPALHAALLSFEHPNQHRPVTFTAPVHDPMKTLLRQLRDRQLDGRLATGGCLIDLEKALG